MPYLAQLAQWLWIPSTAAQAALIYFMLRHRLRGEFTVFFHYTVFQVLSTVAMYPLYRYAWNSAGYATYLRLLGHSRRELVSGLWRDL